MTYSSFLCLWSFQSSLGRLAWTLFAALMACSFTDPDQSLAQSIVVGFESPGELSAQFNLWNDSNGSNGGNYAFVQNPSAGIGGGGVAVSQSTDTTATYQGAGWDFSTNGASIIVSAFVHADGQSSADKVQLGILNTKTNGLNSNAGVAFESFRFVPQSATIWSLREQFRSSNVTTENVLGNITVEPGHWYKFQMGATNTTGGSGGYEASCACYDYGAEGFSAGTNLITFSTFRSHSNQTEVAGAGRVWPGLRAFQDAGIDAWDNFAAFTAASPPLLIAGLTNASIVVGGSVTLSVLADGAEPLSFSWFTNRVLVADATNSSYTTAPLEASGAIIQVVISNPNGSITNSASLTSLVPTSPTISNVSASAIGADSATLSGQVFATGGDIPSISLYYGLSDGRTNLASWSNHISLGLQAGSFSQRITELAPSTTYYFTVEAQNASGIPAWTIPSQVFTTLATNPVPVSGSVAVLTSHNDNARTGANLTESLLTITNVNSATFGLTFTRPVDDQIYAQPLVATNVAVPGNGTHNLVIVATVNDTVYAFDADDAALTTPYWTTSFIRPPTIVAPRNTDMTGACGGHYLDFSGNFGIVGTPVIDPTTGTIYLVARTKENGVTFVQRLHALELATGLERTNSPVVISATYPGSGDGNVNGILSFDAQKQNQRAGLTLVNGTVYITWSSHCDWGPYHGWLIGYDAHTLQQVAVYNDTPDGSNGGIWMSGQAPAADSSGNLYLVTGNGSVGLPGDPSALINRGESFLKLTRNEAKLDVASWFTPFNWQDLENGDIDLGSGGLLLIPGTDLAFAGGKQGIVYLVHRNQMGGLSGTPGANPNVVQQFQVTTDQIHGGAVWWTGPTVPFSYIWPASVHLQQYQFDFTTGEFLLPAFASGTSLAPAGQPGGILALSANGTNAGTGILWASHQLQGDANQQVRPGILRAFNAQNVNQEIYNSSQAGARDTVGNFAKFCPPTVANGKVYLATFSNRLNVYGLLPLPELNASRANNRIILSWPTSGPTYTLQVSSDLVSGSWLEATNRVQVSNGKAQADVSASSSAQFYRLSL